MLVHFVSLSSPRHQAGTGRKKVFANRGGCIEARCGREEESLFLTPVLLDTLTFLKFIKLFWGDRSIFFMGRSFFLA